MALATRKTCAVSGGIGPLWCAGRPAANRAALPPAAKSGGPPTKIGRPGSIEKVGGHPLNKIGRPDRSGGRAAALGRRAALRAATLKLRAAQMWPALGRWAARGGRGARPCVWQQGGPLTRLNNYSTIALSAGCCVLPHRCVRAPLLLLAQPHIAGHAPIRLR